MASGSNQHKLLAAFIILATFTIGTLSVTGLLQSTERVASSGIIVTSSPPPPAGGGGTPPSPPPPEPTVEIDVYSDQACTQTLSSIIWGEIVAGDNSMATIYVKNNGDTDVVLSLDTDGWDPTDASDYMDLTWNYDGTNITPGQVRTINVTLSVSEDCPAMSGFDFDIIIIGS